MSLKVELKDGKMLIDIGDFVNMLPDDVKKEIAQHLAFQHSIIKDVIDMAIHGETETGWWIGHRAKDDASSFPHDIEWARREIAKSKDEIAKQEIETLEATLQKRDDEINDLKAKYLWR